MSETGEKVSGMSKFQASLEKVLMPISEKMSKQRHLGALRDGMMLMIPATIVGGIFMILAMPPVNLTTLQPTNFFFSFLIAWKTWANANLSWLIVPYYMTIGIISVYVSAGVSYSLAKSYEMNPITNVISSLIVLFTVTASSVTVDKSSFYTTAGLGTNSMFFAMISALIVVEIDRAFEVHHITIKMPDVVPPAVSGAFSILYPVLANVTLFLLLNLGCTALTGAGLASLMTTIFSPLVGAVNSLPGILFLNFLNTTFWFFGIHPAGITGSITTPLATMGLTANAEAYAAGEPLPYVFAGNVNSIFGNWTTYLGLCLLMMWICRSSQLKALSKVAIGPSLFDINEPMIFGIPTMMNILMYIPMVICGAVNFTLAYVCIATGLVGKFYINIPAFTPVPLAAFLSGMDWRALILWAVEFALDMAICLPFMKAYDKQLLDQENETAEAEAAEATA